MIESVNVYGEGDVTKMFFSETEARILLALLHTGDASSDEIIRTAGISGSTYQNEKRQLKNLGLIVSERIKESRENGVVHKLEFKLTSRGKLAAQILLVISELVKW
ncbi:MAG: helix-turn-helix domain-containing protein [Nitrososphaerales archaeon]